MRTRQKRVATDTWRSLGCRTTPLEHWSRRKPTVEPRKVCFGCSRQGRKHRCSCLKVTLYTTLKQELSGTKAYKETSEEEKSVVIGHCNHLALKLSVCVKECQDRRPTMYWLPKLNKRQYKARFIANSSSCTTTELSKLLTSCLTAVKNHVIRYCEKVYERSCKNCFDQSNILVRYLIN